MSVYITGLVWSVDNVPIDVPKGAFSTIDVFDRNMFDTVGPE